MKTPVIGIVGGSGMLGSAIARGILDAGLTIPRDLWIANRSGAAPEGLGQDAVTVTTDAQALVEASDLTLLCVPPARLADLKIDARGRLVASVVAGLSLERMGEITGAARLIRAMSSPAAARRLAYSPFVASAQATPEDRALARALFEACGTSDEVASEAEIEVFTAITGPVPGFVAFFAECVEDYCAARGVAPDVAGRAVRQLFLSAGTMLAEDAPSARDHVQEMIDYDGTTAAGLRAMRASPIAALVTEGLDASVEKTRRIAAASDDRGA